MPGSVSEEPRVGTKASWAHGWGVLSQGGTPHHSRGVACLSKALMAVSPKGPGCVALP